MRTPVNLPCMQQISLCAIVCLLRYMLYSISMHASYIKLCVTVVDYIYDGVYDAILLIHAQFLLFQ